MATQDDQVREQQPQPAHAALAPHAAHAGAIRSPIVSVMGHVDHGKSSLLDTLRGTNIVKGEAGAITQAIGASFVPLTTIKERAAELLVAMPINLTIPGLLFIDTPGHAAFTALRKRGGNLADIAIVVIDINEGLMPQTRESIEILKSYKTPFVIALNKIDLIPGYRKKSEILLKDLAMQDPEVSGLIEKRLYETVGKVYDGFSLQAERFDRCDFKTQIPIVPCSATLPIGLPEILVTICGLAQKYLEGSLRLRIAGSGKGTVLEVKDVKGIGSCLDVVLYDGELRIGDIIVIGGIDEAIESRIKGMFIPEGMQEIRDKKAKFTNVTHIQAAAALRLLCNRAEDVTAGMPIRSCQQADVARVKGEVQAEIEEVTLHTDKEGIIIKADTLGSLEALMALLREAKIPMRKASVGNIGKKDLMDAESNYERDRHSAVILGFNVRDESGANGAAATESAKAAASETAKVKVFTSDIIYRLIEDYQGWKEAQVRVMQERELEGITRPSKIEVLRNCVFRASNPAVVGVEILAGQLKPNTPIMKAGEPLSTIKSLQKEKESVSIAKKGEQLAVAIPNVTVGRNLFEEDILYSQLSEEDFRKLKKCASFLPRDEVEVLREIAEIMRKNNPVWGI